MPCIHRNGVITSYSVQYGVTGSGGLQAISVSEDNVTISDLVSSTKYMVQVAAINDAGIGVYSSPITANTDGMRNECTTIIISYPSLDILTVSVDLSSTNSLTISWTQAVDVTATEYIISYTNTDCPDDIYEDITGIVGTMYTLSDLEEGTEYSITVTAILSVVGETASHTVIATTMSIG